MKKPNILFVLADDASHMSIYGHKFLNTPNFDYIANTGVLFNNAFTTNPKCAPSRASILTGLHSWQLEEASTHYCYFPNKFKLYPDLLEENGYFVGFTGKGWAPGDYKKNGLKRNPAGNAYNTKKLVPPEDSKISKCDYFSNFIDFLEQKPDDKPFYFWFGSNEPHRQYQPGEGIKYGLNPDLVEVPSYLPNNDVVRSDFCDYAFEIEWFDKQLGKFINKLKEIGEFDNTLIVVTSDNGAPFPRVKGQMYEDDFKLPLAICYGDKLVGNRKVDDIVSFIDFAPTFLEFAQVDIPPEIEGQSLTDILYSEQDGIVNQNRNVAYMARERHDLGRENDASYPVRVIRTPQYLYVRNLKPDRYPAGNPETWYPNCDGSPTKEEILHLHALGDNYYYNLSFGKRPAEELYDIKNDSECMINLAPNPDYNHIKSELSSRLNKKLLETGDPRMLGDDDYFENIVYIGKDDHSWKAFIENRWQKQPF